jgi:hypothetical protein
MALSRLLFVRWCCVPHTWGGSGSAWGGDVLKVPFETLNVLKGTFEASAMS